MPTVYHKPVAWSPTNNSPIALCGTVGGRFTSKPEAVTCAACLAPPIYDLVDFVRVIRADRLEFADPPAVPRCVERGAYAATVKRSDGALVELRYYSPRVWDADGAGWCALEINADEDAGVAAGATPRAAVEATTKP
jgi:hypothetical protein